jgi:hypothetical protein
MREVRRGNLFGGEHRGRCPAKGVTKGEKATACKVVKGVLVVVEDMVSCLHQEDVSHITYRWESRPDTIV